MNCLGKMCKFSSQWKQFRKNFDKIIFDTALHLAIRTENISFLKLLLAQDNIDVN